MSKIIRLTESDLTRIVKRVIKEQGIMQKGFENLIVPKLEQTGILYNGKKFKVTGPLETYSQGVVLSDKGVFSYNYNELWIKANGEYSISSRMGGEGSGPVNEEGTWTWDGNKITLKKK